MSRTRVRADDDGRLTAHCLDCDVQFVLAPEADVAAALSALDATHPARRHSPRPHLLPPFWLARPPKGHE